MGFGQRGGAVRRKQSSASILKSPARIDKQAHTHLEPQCNIPGLIPPEQITYPYRGSLTTTPGSERGDCFIMEQLISLAPAEIEKIRPLYYGNNRPVMPKSDRLVEIGK